MDGEGREGGERKMATEGLGFCFFFWLGIKKLFPFTGSSLTFTCSLSVALGPFSPSLAGGPTALCSLSEAFGS